MDKKVLIALILGMMLMPLANAVLTVEKKDMGSVVIAELGNPAVFELTINVPEPEDIELYTLVGISLSPRGTIQLKSGTTPLTVQAYLPPEARRVPGPYSFEYQIKGERSGIVRDTMTVTIVNLKDAIEIEPASLKPGAANIRIVVRNTQNTRLENVQLSLDSEFFSAKQTLSLEPFATTTLTIPVDTAKIKSLPAGKYIITGRASIGDAQATLQGFLTYVEQQSVSAHADSKGFLVRTKTLTKTNEGNVPVADTIIVRRDILTRLFTSYSREPLIAERHGIYVQYEWQKELQPGESWSLITTTNYTFPFILVLLVIASAFLVRHYSRTQIVTQKRVSYVKTKGGQFALKVQLTVRARSNVTNVQVIDRLPGMTKMYEKFGTKPDRVDAASRRLFWNIDRLQAGEERVISYIVYSTIKVVGRFELPPALVVFEHNGSTHEALSNRAFFIAETTHVEE